MRRALLLKGLLLVVLLLALLAVRVVLTVWFAVDASASVPHQAVRQVQCSSHLQTAIRARTRR